jgi:hypothetical protein
MQTRPTSMARRYALIPAIALTVILAGLPAMADQQRSDQEPGYALGWQEATGSRDAYAEAPVQPYYPPVRHRRHY